MDSMMFVGIQPREGGCWAIRALPKLSKTFQGFCLKILLLWDFNTSTLMTIVLIVTVMIPMGMQTWKGGGGAIPA